MNSSGLNIGWVWTACHLSHPFIPFHISVFSEVASFPSFSLWAIFFQLKLVPQSLFLWPVPWPAMLLRSVQVWGASWWGWPGCRGHCPPPPRGVQVRVYVPKHDSLLGVEGEGLCSVPQTENPGGLQSTGSQGLGHDWATDTFTFIPCYDNEKFPPISAITSPAQYELFQDSAYQSN